MEITAALVKDLRERTGAGMMDCRKARRKGILNTGHALPQHIVGLPLFTVLQVQLGSGNAMFMLIELRERVEKGV